MQQTVLTIFVYIHTGDESPDKSRNVYVIILLLLL